MSILSLDRTHPDPCPECGSRLVLRFGKKYLQPFYGCEHFPACQGTAGAHADGRPLGRAASDHVKKMRIRIHELTVVLQKRREWSRSELYAWITNVFQASETVHIANLFEKELKVLAREVQRELKWR